MDLKHTTVSPILDRLNAMHLRLLISAATAAALLCFSPPARTQPLNNGNFNVELYQGPVLGSTRVIGLAGAYTAIAEEAIGIPFNPASVANRTHYSVKNFDWDINFTYLKPGLLEGDNFDFDNNKRSFLTDYHIFNYGALIQYKGFGFGLYVRSQVVSFEDKSATPRLYSATLQLGQIDFGYALWKHQIVIGGGLRAGYFSLQEKDVADGERFRTSTLGLEAGAVFRPLRWPFRIAVTAAVPVYGWIDKKFEDATFFLPKGVQTPWEIRVGATYCFCFKKKYNVLPGYLKPKPKKVRKKKARPRPARPVVPPPAPGTPPAKKHAPAEKISAPPPPAGGKPTGNKPTGHEPSIGPSRPAEPPPAESGKAKKPARRRKKPRRGGYYILVSAQMVILGPLKKTIGTDAFFEQIYERTGRGVDVGAHLGVEAEVWRNRLRLRGGGYWEPSRFEHYAGRMHGTFGLELRLFDFKLWGPRSLSLSSSLDLASRYNNVSFSVGFWH